MRGRGEAAAGDGGRPWAPRWWVWPEGSPRARGPLNALDLAYGIYSGRVGARDVAVDGRTGARHVVGEHPSLSAWMRPGRDRAARLYRAALRMARARAESEGRPVEACVPRWASALLDAEQREAFRTLDLRPGTTAETLARRYRALALEHHPDRGGDPRRMRALNRAFAALRALSPA